jgi:hypothetical protein
MTKSLSNSLRAIATACAACIAIHAPAQVILTEIIPGVSTNASSGDTVELYNAGGAPVDLTGWVITDLDPGAVESNVLAELSFAPPALLLPPLQPGEYAVVVFTDGLAGGVSQFAATNYGVYIEAPLASAASSFLDVAFEQVLLTDATGAGMDFVAWHDTLSVPSASTITDMTEDLGALTLPNSNYGLTIGDAAWTGPDLPADEIEYAAATIDFSGLTNVTTYGQGALRRRSVGETFDVGAPDGPTQWEAIPRDQVRLGNPSDDVATVGAIRPLRYAGDFAFWLGEVESSNHPDRRVARDENAAPPDFVEPSAGDSTAWDGILALAMGNDWPACFDAAAAQGYEVVEFLDLPTGRTFHVLRERVVPGEVGFRGQGIFVFDGAPGARVRLVLEAPHPRFDSLTANQTALAIPQIRPRVSMIAGTHRNNTVALTTCDGTFEGGAPYHLSDVAHYTGNFFHATHKYLSANLNGMVALQLHGFCCPGDASYPALVDDAVVSTGDNTSPGVGFFARLLHDRIEAQAFMIGPDLTTCALFPDETGYLGATTNVQGRVSNGVTVGTECNTPSPSASGEFTHLEQDPDVRANPQHIITAIGEAYDLLAPPAGVDGWLELSE